MARLIAKSPCDGMLPAEIGGTVLSEVWPEAITLIAPFKGKKGVVETALKAQSGCAFPAPNRATSKDGARAVWVGPGQALLLGPRVAVDGAAIVDQSDAFAVLRIEGDLAEDALARLCPVDLRAEVFKRGHTSRTMLNHMTVSVTRVAARAFEIMVFRSMARTAVHELEAALSRVEGLRKLG